jgi:hypothetical protein
MHLSLLAGSGQVKTLPPPAALLSEHCSVYLRVAARRDVKRAWKNGIRETTARTALLWAGKGRVRTYLAKGSSGTSPVSWFCWSSSSSSFVNCAKEDGMEPVSALSFSISVVSPVSCPIDAGIVPTRPFP